MRFYSIQQYWRIEYRIPFDVFLFEGELPGSKPGQRGGPATKVGQEHLLPNNFLAKSNLSQSLICAGKPMDAIVDWAKAKQEQSPK